MLRFKWNILWNLFNRKSILKVQNSTHVYQTQIVKFYVCIGEYANIKTYWEPKMLDGDSVKSSWNDYRKFLEIANILVFIATLKI